MLKEYHHDATYPMARCSNSSEASSSNLICFTLDHTPIGDHAQRSTNTVTASLDGMPHNLNVLQVATAISQFYSLLGNLKPQRGFDLNAFSA